MMKFLRASLLAEIADGGQKLSFVTFAGPLRPLVDSKQTFAKKDICFVFDMHTSEAIRQTVARLQQKFVQAGGRLGDIIAGTDRRKAAGEDRMFWDAPVPDFKDCKAQIAGMAPWTKGLQGSYYLQRVMVVKTTDKTAFDYEQHLQDLKRVFSSPDHYIMQAPRESYTECFGGYFYKCTSIYDVAVKWVSKEPVGQVLHEGALQRLFPFDDEKTERVLRKR